MTEGGEVPEPALVSQRVTHVRVVAVGASAGGLAALASFFGEMPLTEGVAFVVVQHLDPSHASILTAQLQQVTSLRVREIVAGEPVEADSVYVLPPGFVVSLENGHLYLTDRALTNVGRSPIDHFFTSLAAAQGPEGVGVVLSGTGSDGTLGLAALQSAGALTVAQTPETAEFGGMPRSAVTAGVVDVIGEIAHIARAVAEHVGREAVPDVKGMASPAELAQVIAQVRERTGHDFSGYKPATLRRRLSRRLSLQQMSSVADYLRLLRDDPSEVERLGQDLLIGVTSFFRDPAVWRSLGQQVFPTMIEERDPAAELRAWVPACSTGEEAYSLAITFLEVAERLGEGAGVPSLRIFATDIEPRAIDRARRGVYSGEVVGDLGEERCSRWFTKEGDQFRVTQRLRDMVVFAVHDVLNDPPFTRLDLISCRNLLIYLEAPLQRRLLTTMHQCLETEGVLVLGMAEGTGDSADLFLPVVESLRIFRPRLNDSQRPPVNIRPVVASAPPALRAVGGQHLLELRVLRSLVRRYAPPAVLTDERGDLLYVSGRTGGILEAPSGRVNWNLMALVPEHVRWVLGQALRTVVDTREPVDVTGLRFGTSYGRDLVDVHLQALHGAAPDAVQVLVIFLARVDPASTVSDEVSEQHRVEEVDHSALSRELARVHQELQIAYSELHAANEQQTSMNEELQSANEQLQSTNEELMVSMEEVQSMNEELQTLNQELQARVDELVSASDDMGNLLNSTEIATVFLDAQLNVRRFTPHATSVIRLREVDVGRPVSDIATTLRYAELIPDALEVIRTAAPHHIDIPTTDGRWFAVRIMPYRTHDERLDGVVITFADITAAKTLEADLRANHAAAAEVGDHG
jgi:chemotaxis methyl-accepting protein methylase